jgi:predicted transcriptional regulator
MTKLLEEAIAKVRELSAEEQDEAAEIMLAVAAKRGGPVPLDEQTRAAVRRGVGRARRGEFVSNEEMAAFWAGRSRS